MKKIMFLLSLMFVISFVVDVGAQTKATTMQGSGDTITDTGSDYLLAKVINPYDVASFQVINKKVSGTVAGKTYFYGSLIPDENSYILLDSMTNSNDDTYNKKLFTDNPSRFIYYKVVTTGTGTMKLTTSGYCILRR